MMLPSCSLPRMTGLSTAPIPSWPPSLGPALPWGTSTAEWVGSSHIPVHPSPLGSEAMSRPQVYHTLPLPIHQFFSEKTWKTYKEGLPLLPDQDQGILCANFSPGLPEHLAHTQKLHTELVPQDLCTSYGNQLLPD